MIQNIGQKNWKLLIGTICLVLGTQIVLPLYAEFPKGLGLRSAKSVQTQAEDAEKAWVEKNWNLLRWSTPFLLLNELEEVSQNAELKNWSESVEKLVSRLSQTFPAAAEDEEHPRRIGGGKIIHAIAKRGEESVPVSLWDFENREIIQLRQELLAELTQKVLQARAIQKNLKEPTAAAFLVRANYTLQRRVILWNYCNAMMTLTMPPETASVLLSDWQNALAAAEVLVEAHPYHETWRSYLRIDALKKFPDMKPSERREIAWQILERLHPVDLDASQKQFLAQDAFRKLETLLTRFGSERTADDYLMRMVEDYEADSDLAAGNRIVMESRRLAMEQGKELPQALTALELVYRNANLRLAVASDFLNSSLPQPGAEERTIQENVLNRTVYGRGVSNTSLSVKMIPDDSSFRVGFLVEGTMKSSTYSPKVVTVFNQADARYAAVKEILFSSRGLRTKPAVASVQSQIQLRDLQTPLDPIPVLGFVANGVARNQAEARQEEARQLAENKIRNEVCSSLDEQVGEKLTLANQFLQEKILTPLNRLELNLDQIDAQTTEEMAIIRFRLAGGMQPGAFTPRPVPPPGSQLNFQIHESSVNNFLQQFRLEGRTFTVESLIDHIRTRLPNLDFSKFQKPEEELLITFADANALRVHFEDGRFMIRVCVRELRVGKRIWKNFEVEAPYLVSAGLKEIFVQRDGPVRLIGRIPVGQQIAVRGIFSKVFQKTDEKNVLPEKFVQNPRFAELVLDQIVVQDGWLGISFGPQTAGLALR